MEPILSKEEILDKSKKFMEIKNLSKDTIAAYQSIIRRFLDRYYMHPDEYTEDHIFTFFYDLFVVNDYSGSYVSQGSYSQKLWIEKTTHPSDHKLGSWVE